MSRYFFEIEYNGKEFFGWQIQPNEITLQQVIEESLTKLNSNQSVSITGCGRTDTGVHANQYFFHVDINLEDTIHFKNKLNSMLAPSVVIKRIFKVSSDLHARFNATRRTYRYYVHFNRRAFSNDTSLFLKHRLNFSDMNTCAAKLIGKKDFSSFARSKTDVSSHICEVYSAEWKIINENNAYFEITANRFLRNMVRAVVGTLMDVGIHKINEEEFDTIILSKNRSYASTSAPAHGLFLWSVEYGFDD